jgi:thiol-disulfide isomerase/thioredoxin
MELSNVGYLEDFDFDNNGNLINPQIPKNQSVVVLVFASWCAWCKKIKPDFQEFANNMKGKVFCAAIQADGAKPSEKKLMDKMKTIKPDFRGFPDVMLFVNGKRVNKELKDRTVQGLVEFSRV